MFLDVHRGGATLPSAPMTVQAERQICIPCNKHDLATKSQVMFAQVHGVWYAHNLHIALAQHLCEPPICVSECVKALIKAIMMAPAEMIIH
jgi:hypothetical protein